MTRLGHAVIAGALVVGACGSQQKRGPAPIDPAAVVAAPAKRAPVCEPPSQVALSQRADDYESSRLLVVDVASHEVVWRGPTGSGNHLAQWSRDGSMLAYTLGEDLIVHGDRGADRLVYRGLDPDSPRFSFSPDGRLIAAAGVAGVVIVDLAGASNLRVSALETGIACAPDRLLWTRDGTRLVVTCGDEGVLQVWSSTQRNVTQHELEGVDRIFGWQPMQQDMLIVEADGAVLAISLDGSVRHHLRSEREDELFVTNYIEPAGLLEYSDYGPDDGAPRTIWLAPAPPAAVASPAAPPPIAQPPPLAWIDGPIFDIGYSPDGAWAAFATSVDSMDESGDVYLARVGDPKVTMVIQMPRPTEDDDGDDSDEDLEEEDPDLDPVYYVGYAAPMPRPVPGSRCRASAPSTNMLRIGKVIGDADEHQLYPGVIVAPLESGAVSVMYGDELAMIEAPVVDGALGLVGGSMLLDASSAVRLLGPDGADRASLPAMDLEQVQPAPGGGFVLHRDPRTVELYDEAGVLTGTYQSIETIEEVTPTASGGAIASLAGGEVVTIDAAGKRLASFKLGAPRKVVPLSAEVLVHAEPAAQDSDDEDYDEYAEQWVNLVFESPTGKTLGHYRALSPESETAALIPLGNGTLAALTGAERTRLHLLDARGRLRGTFKIGSYSEDPPVALDDGTVIVRGGYHDLYLIDSRGRYLGGISLDEEIYEGPYRMGPTSFAVQTESRVLVLHRPGH